MDFLCLFRTGNLARSDGPAKVEEEEKAVSMVGFVFKGQKWGTERG